MIGVISECMNNALFRFSSMNFIGETTCTEITEICDELVGVWKTNKRRRALTNAKTAEMLSFLH
jgi:hypothetical protein